MSEQRARGLMSSQASPPVRESRDRGSALRLRRNRGVGFIEKELCATCTRSGRRLCRRNRVLGRRRREGAVEGLPPLSGAGFAGAIEVRRGAPARGPWRPLSHSLAPVFPAQPVPLERSRRGPSRPLPIGLVQRSPSRGTLSMVRATGPGRRDPVRRPRPEWSRHAPGRAETAAPRDTGVRGSWFGAFVARSPALRRTRAETGLP